MRYALGASPDAVTRCPRALGCRAFVAAARRAQALRLLRAQRGQIRRCETTHPMLTTFTLPAMDAYVNTVNTQARCTEEPLDLAVPSAQAAPVAPLPSAAPGAPVAVPLVGHRPPLAVKAPRRLEREHGFEPLRVEGTLPPDLEGTYLRNGPAVFDKGPDQHWFDANGAVLGVRLSAGQAQGAVRETHSPSSDYDRGRRRPRYAGFAQRMSPVQRLRSLFGAPAVGNAANINVMVWQEHLLALHESALPIELDPGPDTVVGEPELVARSEREGDVWVLAVLNDLGRRASCLAIWDGLSQEDEPVARIWFEQLLPFGLHGCLHSR